MKKIIRTLSGRPKSGDVIECIRPLVFFPQLVICIAILICGFSSDSLPTKTFCSICAVLMAWQAGWGMSVERFHKSEENFDESTEVSNG